VGVVEQPLQVLDAAPDAVALLVDVALEHVDVVEQGLAGLEQVVDLGLRVAHGLGLGGGAGLRRRLARLAQQAGRLVLGFVDRGVGRALRQHERASQRLVGVAAPTAAADDGFGDGRSRTPPLQVVDLTLHVGQPALGRLGAVVGLAEAVLQLPDSHGNALEEVVDVPRVVPTPSSFPELDVMECLGSQFHDRESSETATIGCVPHGAYFTRPLSEVACSTGFGVVLGFSSTDDAQDQLQP
jgi:hypothetical protein